MLSRRWAIFSHNIRERTVPGFSRFISAINTLGSFLPSILFLISDKRYLPFFALYRVSNAGVADPNTHAHPHNLARRTAISLPLYRGFLSCLYAVSCSSSTIISRRFFTGANTQLRAPTTTRASPRARARQASSLCQSDRLLCQATSPQSPRRLLSLPTVCGVSAISGTRNTHEPPFSSTLFIARI